MSLFNRPGRPHQDAELNLIPLIDVMSVLVTFLLIYTADVEVVQNNKGIEIPQSTAETQASPSEKLPVPRKDRSPGTSMIGVWCSPLRLPQVRIENGAWVWVS